MPTSGEVPGPRPRTIRTQVVVNRAAARSAFTDLIFDTRTGTVRPRRAGDPPPEQEQAPPAGPQAYTPTAEEARVFAERRAVWARTATERSNRIARQFAAWAGRPHQQPIPVTSGRRDGNYWLQRSTEPEHSCYCLACRPDPARVGDPQRDPLCWCPLCAALLARRFPNILARVRSCRRALARSREVRERVANARPNSERRRLFYAARQALRSIYSAFASELGNRQRRRDYRVEYRCQCDDQHCPACNPRQWGNPRPTSWGVERSPWNAECRECNCGRCYPNGRNCGRCSCQHCYPFGRSDCRNVHCQECGGSGRGGDCGDPACGTCNVVREYSFAPAPRFFALAKGRKVAQVRTIDRSIPFYGIEVEAERNRSSPISREGLVALVRKVGDGGYYVKGDGSLRDGIEVVSHPATFAAWCARGPEMAWAEQLRKAGCSSYNTDTCGMHVHVSRSAVSEAAQAKILLFFARYTPSIATWSRRKSELLARYARIEVDGGSVIVDKVKNYGIATGTAERRHGPQRHSAGRYVALNLTNQHTLEVRIFRGTLISRSILTNIGLVESFVGFARVTPSGNITMAAFLDYVYGESKNIKRTPRERDVLRDVFEFIEPTVDANLKRERGVRRGPSRVEC